MAAVPNRAPTRYRSTVTKPESRQPSRRDLRMPFFNHPADPTSWLLPLVSGMLQLSSLLFRGIAAIAPIGIPILVAVVIGLFAMNLMKEPYTN